MINVRSGGTGLKGKLCGRLHNPQSHGRDEGVILNDSSRILRNSPTAVPPPSSPSPLSSPPFHPPPPPPLVNPNLPPAEGHGAE